MTIPDRKIICFPISSILGYKEATVCKSLKEAVDFLGYSREKIMEAINTGTPLCNFYIDEYNGGLYDN